MTLWSPSRQDTAPGACPDAARLAGDPLSVAAGAAGAAQSIDSITDVLSHDLRAPLRAIGGYVQVLVEDFGGELSPEARDVVARIREASHTMEARVDALLRLSRLPAAPLSSGGRPCDLAAIAAPIVDELRRRAPDRRAVVTVAPAMLVDGDPALLGIVMDNLIDNAWKYTRRRDPAIIEIGYRREHDRAVAFVRDNGIGFEMAQAHRLGVPFQRLHAAPDYEGTGIGLASTMRILTRHGGRLWAEGSPEQGATFWFSLPLPRTR